MGFVLWYNMAQVLAVVATCSREQPSPFEQPSPLASAMSGVVEESTMRFLATHMSGISMPDGATGADANQPSRGEKSKEGTSTEVVTNRNPATTAVKALETVESENTTTTEGDDEMMRQLSLNLGPEDKHDSQTSTSKAEDEVMRQLSANLSALGIAMKPVSAALELQEQSLLLPPHPSRECLLPTSPKAGDEPVGVVYDESMKLHIGPAGTSL